MNRKLKSAINKFCYKMGLEHYEKVRNSMVIKANALDKAGKPDDEILESLGVSAYKETNINTQEAAIRH